MAKREFVSRFSPNRTDPKILEAIFVQRHRLAEVWLESLQESVQTETKHHLLAVGPRGSGKSHLVALLISRLNKDVEIQKKVRIAWLPEDETTSSFWKFLLRIHRALNHEYGDEFPPPPSDELMKATDDRRSKILTDHLLKHLQDRTLLVVVENLDDALRGMKIEGQKRWRSFLQEHPVSATLATAQQLTEDLSSREKPFFNFFQVERLQPLSSGEAAELLHKVADLNKDQELAEFLETPTGRARVRAVRHIAGGSHRIFMILSEFVTRENLDDLVSAFEQLLDELTPYYQERLRWLPDQQREIVEYLCRLHRTASVKDIAGTLYLSEQTTAAQLKSLKDKGYVTSASVGRESRYELAESLMRLCIEVKDPRREPIRLVVDFLRIWYDQERVEVRLKELAEHEELERLYLEKVKFLEKPGKTGPIDEAFARDLADALATGDSHEFKRVLEDLAATSTDGSKIIAVARKLEEDGNTDAALEVYDARIGTISDDWVFWLNKIRLLSRMGRSNDALKVIVKYLTTQKAKELVALDMIISATKDLDHDNLIAFYDRMDEVRLDTDLWVAIAAILVNRKQYRHALLASEQAIKRNTTSGFLCAVRAIALHGLGKYPEALASLAGSKSFSRQFMRHIFESSKNIQEWRREIFTLADNIENARRLIKSQSATSADLPPPISSLDPLEAMTSSLIESLSPEDRTYKYASPESLRDWVQVWRELAEAKPEFSFAVRLFEVGIRYIQEKDERVLLDLVSEERKILRDLFRLDEPEQENA